jgi:hypothetical protein
MPDTGKKTDPILLDLHSAAPSVTALTAFQFVIYEVRVDLEIGWNPLQERYKGLTVRLASCPKTEHGVSITQVQCGF